MALEYIYPVVYAEENNYTFIRKTFFTMIDCSKFTPDTECNIWSNQKCGSDSSYCQPFIDGDKIYLQYKSHPSTYSLAIFQIFDSQTDDEVTGATTIQIGQDETGVLYENILIDTAEASFPDCWYGRLTLFTGNINPVILLSCRSEKIAEGLTTQQAMIECALEQGAERSEVYSEPWCRVKCDQESILFTGSYSGYDCDGNYYGDVIVSNNPQANIYQASVRILGEIVHDGTEFIENISGGIRTSVQSRKKFTILGHEKLPPYVANQISICLGSKIHYIDGVNYQGITKIDKSFEEGKSWIMKLTGYTECDEIDTACE